MADKQITCITKPNEHSGHEGITHVGGDGWKLSVPSVVAAIESRTDTFFTLVNNTRANVGVVNGAGGKYLRTYADQTWTDNLLALPSCP